LREGSGESVGVDESFVCVWIINDILVGKDMKFFFKGNFFKKQTGNF